MKIEKLLAPKQEEIVTESDAGTSTAGSVASVNMPLGRVQRRGKGSMLQGIKTSAKFPNSVAVKEGAYDDGVNDGIRGEANPRASSIYGPESGEYSRGYKDGLVKGKQQQQQNIANYQAELAPYKEIETDDLNQMLRDIRKRNDETQAIFDKYRGASRFGGDVPPNVEELKKQGAIDSKAWQAIHQELFQRGVPNDQRMEEGVTEESSLQGIDPDFDKLLLRRDARRMGMTVPEYLHHLEKQKQDREHELSIGTQGRAELKQKADELAELRREKLRKERLEDEELAFQRAETIQQRKDEMQKIADKYKHDLKVIDTEHRNNMEAINTNNKFELDKLDKEYNDAQREREHQSGESDKEYRDRREQRQQELARERERQRAELDKAKIDAQAAVDAAQAQQPASQPFQSQTPPKQPRPRPSMGAGDMDTPRPQRPQAQSQKPPMWHTSQQVGMNKPPKLGYNNGVTDVEPKPPKPGNMLALKEEPMQLPSGITDKSYIAKVSQACIGGRGTGINWEPDPKDVPYINAERQKRGLPAWNGNIRISASQQPYMGDTPINTQNKVGRGLGETQPFTPKVGDAIMWRPKLAKMIPIAATVIAASADKLKIKLAKPPRQFGGLKEVMVVNIADSDITPQQGMAEAKKANTKTARQEFGKRPRADLSDKEKEQKKSESDAAWERLMAYAAAQKKEKVDEKSVSQAQFRTMAAAAHNPEFAKKVGISQKVGKEFHSADKNQNYKNLPAKVEEGSEVDISVVVGKLYDIIDHAENTIKTADYDQQVQYATSVRDRAVKALNMIKSDPSNVNSAWNYLQNGEQGVEEEKQRLDPKCWSGYKKQGTKMKGGVRVNNCVKVDEAEFTEDKLAQDLYRDLQIFKKGADKDIGSKAKDKDISSKAKDKEIQKKK